ncbi:MAG: hypothetical protein KGZ79_02760 [Dethiobacter sp.]|nr:hypothetical protein [Dethiobacter sp.]
MELLLVDNGSGDANEETSYADHDAGESPVNSACGISPHFKEALLIVEKIKEVFLGNEEKYCRGSAGVQLYRILHALFPDYTIVGTVRQDLRLDDCLSPV